MKLLAIVIVLVIAGFVDAGPFKRLRDKRHPSPPPKPAAQAVVGEFVGAEPAMRGDLDKKSFAGALQAQLAGKASLTHEERKLLRIVNNADSPRRANQLRRMEAHVRVELEMPLAGEVNWATVDWPRLLQMILQILVLILPLL